jgi:hypothetical protein
VAVVVAEVVAGRLPGLLEQPVWFDEVLVGGFVTSLTSSVPLYFLVRTVVATVARILCRPPLQPLEL